ncbi:sensor histidine kinase [Paenibacillus sp.]|uniref:sensor histidine kinase n=1 Tax=Paenibacillus sp. TaxID=58172 RepID=UPI002D3384AA|nr:sensor histidine kinase [Paenibacillus sp.]HZG88431.1 sensor histidine kinase [Paenibacillus sp.]
MERFGGKRKGGVRMELHLKRAWGWADSFVVAVRTVGFVLSLIHVYGLAPAGHRFGLLAVGLLAFAVPQLFYLPRHIRAKRYIAAEAALSGGFTLYASMVVHENAQSCYLIPLFVMSYLASKKVLYGVVLVGFAAMVPGIAASFGHAPGYVVGLASNFALFAALGHAFGHFLRQKHQLTEVLAAIEEKNRELEHYIRQVERVTLLEERNRMSRELHDTVGHSLTASIVAMEAVHTLMDRDPEAARHRLKELIAFNRANLDGFRRTVHDMAMNELKLPLVELLRQAAEGFAERTGTAVVVEADELPFAATQPMKLALLRCLQETLTNAKKHGGASEVRVKLTAEGGKLLLTVQDNGAGADGIAEGFGIEGMKERIESLRGSLRIVSEAGRGTTVACEIPTGG